MLNRGESLFRGGGMRVLWVGDDSYVNGEKIVTPYRAAAALAARYDISREQLGDALEDPSFLALLASLINSGYWYLKTDLPGGCDAPSGPHYPAEAVFAWSMSRYQCGGRP